MGNTCCLSDTPDHQRSNSSTGAVPSASVKEVQKRPAYDSEMREHLLGHSTPHKVKLTIECAATLIAKAHHAHEIVEQRRANQNCLSMVALPPPAPLPHSPSARGRKEEESQKYMNREEKIEDGLKLLMNRVNFIKVKVVHMEDDGNCQFRSLAYELFGDQKHHYFVRSRVVEYMRSHKESYMFYVGETAEDWSKYLSKMAKVRTWGDELTIRAACDCFGSLVHVITTEHENWLLNYIPTSLEEAMHHDDRAAPPPGTRECFLAYVSPIHYNVIVPLEDYHEASKTGY